MDTAEFSKNIQTDARGVLIEPGTALLDYWNHSSRVLLLTSNPRNAKLIRHSESPVGALLRATVLNDRTLLATDGHEIWTSRDWSHWETILESPQFILRSDPFAISVFSQMGALRMARDHSLEWTGPRDLMEVTFTTASAMSNMSVVAATKGIGLYGRDTYRLIKSDDGGKHWLEMVGEGGFSFDPSGNYQVQHLFFMGDTCWVSSDVDDGLFCTTDGGRTWRRVPAPDRVISGIYFRNLDVGRIIGGSTLTIYETRDGGAHWRSLSRDDVASPEFTRFFGGSAPSRWNDFAIYRLVLRQKENIDN
jgi:hypothetical protein